MHPTRVFVLYNLLVGLSTSMTVVIYIPLLIANGLTLSDIALVNVIFWFCVVIFEVPTGMIADGRSRRFSICCGALALCFGSAFYAGVRGFWTAVIAECLVAIGNAFTSGALQAWLTDALRHRNEQEKLRHAFATGSIASSLAMIVGGFFSGIFLAPSYPRLGWAMGALFAAAALITAVFVMNDSGEPVHRVSEFHALKESVGALKKSPSLIWASAASMLMGLVIPFNLYWTPLLKERVGSVGVAWSWIPIYGAAALAGFYIRRSKKPVGREAGMIAMSFLISGVGLGFVFVTKSVYPLLGLIVLHELGRGFFSPLVDTFTQQHVGEHFRATYGSLQSLIGRAGYAFVLVGTALGVAGKPVGGEIIVTVFGFCGVGLIVAAIGLWFLRPDRKPG